MHRPPSSAPPTAGPANRGAAPAPVRARRGPPPARGCRVRAAASGRPAAAGTALPGRGRQTARRYRGRCRTCRPAH
ncbi:hypothetical protein G6F65_019892 [Rhizopus arrhizus]|uniref:Uncharacterized protein n=1 Tax=Rhizopus delemar TaxID=936053 RepID=A0A9P6XNV3_9FUNG|nr:hypothetical protein G6F68_020265 [Rhizopus microsporus]KAG1247944.1 hypothetical protein G6F65_019892 [Rhizopus arrhizus]KAG1529540.1 hypothetical protein G6F50_017930 [Rhizopus delemar]